MAGEGLVLVVDAKGRVRHCTPALARRLGVPEAAVRPGVDLADLPVGDGVDPEDLRRLREVACQARAGSQPEPLSLLVRDGAQGEAWFEVDLIGSPDTEEGRLLHFRDVTTRWANLIALCEREQRYRVVAEATRDIVMETDSQLRFTFVSDACREVLGFEPEELLGTHPGALHNEEDLQRFAADVERGRRTGKPFRASPHRLRRKDGTWVWFESTGLFYTQPDGEVHMIGVARDISDRISAEQARAELESRILGTQKLESLGILAGGIAHDFNNLLTPILGNAGIIAMDLPEGSPSLAQVDAIRIAARRAAALTQQMLAYSGQGMFQVSDVDVSHVIQEMALLLESTVRGQAVLEIELDPALPHIRADASQIGQVVMNLVANGAESLPESGGRVRVRTRVADVDRALLDTCILGSDREPGRFVAIEVEDTGSGLDPDTRERMFDPFYTTKFTGRGLGLATVLGIVQGHSGAIQVESAPGRGTRFCVLLPIGSEPLEVAGRADAHARVGRGDLSGQHVLVVDDDPGSLEWTSLALGRAGMRVHAFDNGAEALAWLDQSDRPVGAAVLDYLMPELNGAELLRALRARQPDIPTVFISGYAQDTVVEDLQPMGRVSFLQKPCTAGDLLSAVDALIGDDA